MNPLVSCIVPVYNLENCIEYCLKSLLAQTYPNWEAILVDDGSRDGSAQILKKYESMDSRFRYVFKENGGLASARNAGLDQVKGDYVFFLDGDDPLHPQTFECMVQCMQSTQTDIGAFNFQKTDFYPEQYTMYESFPTPVALSYRELSEVNGETILFKMVTTKVYKKDVACSLRFSETAKVNEDHTYNVRLFSARPLSIYFVDLPLYYYYQRAESICHTVNIQKCLNAVEEFSRACEDIQNCQDSFLKAHAMKHLFLAAFQVNVQSIPLPEKKTVRKQNRKMVRKWVLPWLRSSEFSPVLRLSFVAFLYCAKLYEIARIHQDPSMKDYFHTLRNQK